MIEIKYKYKEIRFEINEVVEIYFLIKGDLRYKEKMSKKLFIKFIELVLKHKDGKIKSIQVNHIDNFVNFRAKKKNTLLSMFIPENRLIRIFKIMKEMIL